MGSSQAVRQWVLVPPCEGSIPSSPADEIKGCPLLDILLFYVFERERDRTAQGKGSEKREFFCCGEQDPSPLRTEGFSERIRLDGTLFDPSPPMLLYEASSSISLPP